MNEKNNLLWCSECNSELIKNENSELVCRNCGLIQDIRPTKNPLINKRILDGINKNLGSTIQLSRIEKINPKFQRLAFIHRNIINSDIKVYEEKKAAFFTELRNLLNILELKTNIRVNKRIFTICEKIYLKNKGKRLRNRDIVLSAIIFYYSSSNILSLYQLQNLISSNIDQYTNIYKHINILKQSGYNIKTNPQIVKNQLLECLRVSKEFNKRCKIYNHNYQELRKKVNSSFNNELSKFPTHRQKTTQVIGRAIYNILKETDNRIISMRLAENSMGIVESTLREQRYDEKYPKSNNNNKQPKNKLVQKTLF